MAEQEQAPDLSLEGLKEAARDTFLEQEVRSSAIATQQNELIAEYRELLRRAPTHEVLQSLKNESYQEEIVRDPLCRLLALRHFANQIFEGNGAGAEKALSLQKAFGFTERETRTHTLRKAFSLSVYELLRSGESELAFELWRGLGMPNQAELSASMGISDLERAGDFRQADEAKDLFFGEKKASPNDLEGNKDAAPRRGLLAQDGLGVEGNLDLSRLLGSLIDGDWEAILKERINDGLREEVRSFWDGAVIEQALIQWFHAGLFAEAEQVAQALGVEEATLFSALDEATLQLQRRGEARQSEQLKDYAAQRFSEPVGLLEPIGKKSFSRAVSLKSADEFPAECAETEQTPPAFALFEARTYLRLLTSGKLDEAEDFLAAETSFRDPLNTHLSELLYADGSPEVFQQVLALGTYNGPEHGAYPHESIRRQLLLSYAAAAIYHGRADLLDELEEVRPLEEVVSSSGESGRRVNAVGTFGFFLTHDPSAEKITQCAILLHLSPGELETSFHSALMESLEKEHVHRLDELLDTALISRPAEIFAAKDALFEKLLYGEYADAVPIAERLGESAEKLVYHEEFFRMALLDQFEAGREAAFSNCQAHAFPELSAILLGEGRTKYSSAFYSVVLETVEEALQRGEYPLAKNISAGFPWFALELESDLIQPFQQALKEAGRKEDLRTLKRAFR